MVEQAIRGDRLLVGREATLDLSVVCPFFDEEKILEQAIRVLHARLEAFAPSSELIVVDDGSTDGSLAVAEGLRAQLPRLRVLTYEHNRGRGHALRAGLAQARGAIVVTTEIDLSWGEDIVERLHAAATEHPDVDIVVASPHLPGGGYRNVPANRVLLSRLGNHVIRSCMTAAVTMNTGMTRAYRREAIRSLPLEEDKKEFHLEVILKAQALGYRFHEIPALLEWKEYKHQGQRVKRKSSSKIKRLMLTHSLFSLFANPIRYVWALSLVSFALVPVFLGWGVARIAMGLDSVFMAIVALSFTIIGVMLFAFGLLAQQGNMIQSELWRLKRELREVRLEREERERRVARPQVERHAV